MQKILSEKVSRWLLPAVLILFILEVMTLPLVLGITYSGRSESPDHILTYTSGRLTWDSSTDIDDTGTACLSLFDVEYPGAESFDGSKIIAPGTEGYNIVRLKNSTDKAIKYTAVLYAIRTIEDIPVRVGLIGSDFADTADFLLPAGVGEKQVVRAVTGMLGGDEIQDFDISWLWEYESDEDQDYIDTFLGACAGDYEITVGIYIVVEDDDGGYVTPDVVPKTGSESWFGMYVILMLISFIILILLLWDRHKEKKCV